MSEKFDLTAIQNEQKAIMLLTEEVQKTSDAEERDALVAAIRKSAEKIQAMSAEMQARADAVTVPKVENFDIKAVVEVVLTPDQRKRVLEAYGVDVPSVRFPDSTGTLTRNMKNIEPDYIEECAMKQAKAFKDMVAEAEAAAESEAEADQVTE